MYTSTIYTGLVTTALMAVGAAVGYAFFHIKSRALYAELLVKERDIQDQARRAADQEVAATRRALEETGARERAEFKQHSDNAAARHSEMDGRLMDREAAITRQLDRFAVRETELREWETRLKADRTQIIRQREELRQLVAQGRAILEQAANMTAADARAQLLKQVEAESLNDAAKLSRNILEKARLNSEEQARRIIGLAIQRYAGKHTFETTTATVSLTGDEMKGRIIGRDGRNIRAFENTTGITVLVDDTPNAVVLSGFDPVRREVARLTMERLILDGRIHPTRIEEVYAAVKLEMETFVQRKGEEAVHRAGQPPLHPEIVKQLGRLHFRTSFSQNVLHHSIEVAHLCGLMAAELGVDPQLARRAGLLHDLGKAMSHEMEGPHAMVGAEFIKQHGEAPLVVNAVAAHHDEVPHESIYGILVSAADAISAARPGGRSESMTTYLHRLEQLEQVAMSFEGVEKAFAIQAGRELRVLVRPEQLDDARSSQLARDLARRIEDQLDYPGQIRVTVVRETRCMEYAK